MINVSIVGGAGYTGGELIRLLLGHPYCTLTQIISKSQVGKPIHRVHKDLLGQTDLIFDANLNHHTNLIFLCSGHGKSKEFLENNSLDPEISIIDLSSDYRLNSGTHEFIYGLAELNREKIKDSGRIANCGCFATCIQLGLLPLAMAQQLNSEIHITAITGSTGAGQQPTETTHFSWRNDNLSIYKAFRHQHIPEIKQGLVQLQPSFDSPIRFIPIRGDFSRGIFASIYLESELSLHEAKKMFTVFYQDSPFVHLSDYPISMKDVVNTNNSFLFIEKHDTILRIESTLDNLLKGASGQAVQNMNLMFNFPEDAGLQLKACAF